MTMLLMYSSATVSSSVKKSVTWLDGWGDSLVGWVGGFTGWVGGGFGWVGRGIQLVGWVGDSLVGGHNVIQRETLSHLVGGGKHSVALRYTVRPASPGRVGGCVHSVALRVHSEAS